MGEKKKEKKFGRQLNTHQKKEKREAVWPFEFEGTTVETINKVEYFILAPFILFSYRSLLLLPKVCVCLQSVANDHAESREKRGKMKKLSTNYLKTFLVFRRKKRTTRDIFIFFKKSA